MKLKTGIALLLVILLLTASFGIQAVQIQNKPTVIQGKPTVIAPTQIKIIMERAPLESAKGMPIFETRVLPVRNDLIERFGKEQGLVLQPHIVANQRLKLRAFTEKDQNFTRLLVDEDRGHFILLPRIESLAKTEVKLLPRDLALKTALNQVMELKLIPQDESQVTPNQVITLSKADLVQGKQGPSKDVIQTVIFQRTINQKAVVGQGSQLMVDLGENGQVVGLSQTWNQLARSNIQLITRNDQEIYNEIESSLKNQFRGASEIRVTKPRLVYYGDDRKFVQPAYFYSAEIATPNSIGKSYYAGFVAAAKNAPEPIKLQRAADKNILPQNAVARNNYLLPRLGGTVLAAGEPTVGRYVVRDDSHDWVDDANDFKDGLIDGHHGGLPSIVFGDYYWDYPRLWTNQESSFVDKWNVVLMEGHGNHWLFTTRSNCCDVVNLNSATQPGYGDRAGSSMRFLILKGCSIVPAPPDRGNWPDPWWRIFKGLRQAVGFRTTMYINDDISDHFGYHLGNNCRVLDSWFHATNNCSSYQWNRFWGAHVTGYGAVVMIPGHEGDGIYHIGAAPPATTTGLTIWWQH